MPVRALFFCQRHGQQGWHEVAWVTDTQAYNDRLGTAMEDVPYPAASRDVRGDCDWCEESTRRFVIDFSRMRAVMDAAPVRRGVRRDIDEVARRPGDNT